MSQLSENWVTHSPLWKYALSTKFSGRSWLLIVTVSGVPWDLGEGLFPMYFIHQHNSHSLYYTVVHVAVVINSCIGVKCVSFGVKVNIAAVLDTTESTFEHVI